MLSGEHHTRGLILFLALLWVPWEAAWGQKASSWRVYKMADGLPEPSCVSVSIGSRGKVLVRHRTQAYITELDGYGRRVFAAPKGLASRVYEVPSGQLWTVSETGLLEFRDGAWVPHPLPEIAALPKGASQDQVLLCPVRQGEMLVLLPDRLLKYDSSLASTQRVTVFRRAAETGLGAFTGMVPARDGGLWICGKGGLLKAPGPVRTLKPTTEWREFLIPESEKLSRLSMPIEDFAGGVSAIGEQAAGGHRVFVYFDREGWTIRPTGLEQVRAAWRGPDDTWWAMSNDRLYQRDSGQAEMVETDELGVRLYYDVAIDPSGAFWLATSDGLFRYAPLTWRTPRPLQAVAAPIHGMTIDPEDRLWFATSAGLYSFHKGMRREYPFPRDAARRLLGTEKLFWLKNGRLLMALERGFFEFDPASGTFQEKLIGTGSETYRVTGTAGMGTVALQMIPPAREGPPYELRFYDGQRLAPFAVPSLDLWIGVGLTAVFQAQDGDWWLSGEKGTAVFHAGKWQAFEAADGAMPEGAVSFVEPMEGKIWCAGQDKVWEYDGKTWSALRGGFDRLHQLVRGRDGVFWLASNGGVYRSFLGRWVENGIEEGLPNSAVRELCLDNAGRIWAGTTHGLSCFFPEADREPPHTWIQEAAENEILVPENGSLSLNFRGEDKWKFTPRFRLLYSYRIDEQDWSPEQDQTALTLSELSPGKHYFQVRTIDRNCNVDPRPARIEFSVVLPWYKEMRLLLIAGAGGLVALFFAWLALNTHLRLVRSYAEVERKVAERTRELEAANKVLLHSQKMTALGTLAAGIAHDFNNILSIIKGSAQIIEENLENPAKVQTRLDRIKTMVEQGSGIVKAMLGFSRDSAQQPTACELNAVVGDTIRLLGDRFLREIEVRFEPGAEIPKLSASRDFIQQILLNFIFNAAEASEPRQPIIVTTQKMEHLPSDLVLTPGSGPFWLAVSVKDSGTGIPPEVLPRIFEPFFTTKAFSARRGTGLGLSMAYELAKKMESGLGVRSALGQGSTFTLYLPFRQPVEPSQAGELSADEPTVLKS
jgi:signal transduction histidine kinase